MVNFSEFKNNSVDRFNKENVVLSKKLLHEFEDSCNLHNIDRCYIIPQKPDPETYIKIRKYFIENKIAILPVGCLNSKNTPFRFYAVSKKRTLTTEQFKSVINNFIDIFDNCEVVYKNPTTCKSICNYDMYEVKTDVLKYIEEKYNKASILGLEIPLNESTKTEYYNNGLMVYPTKIDNIRKEKNWNQHLDK